MTTAPITTIAQLLASLAEHPHELMRNVAARNPALPSDLVEKLARDPVRWVRSSAAPRAGGTTLP